MNPVQALARESHYPQSTATAYRGVASLPAIWAIAAQQFGNTIALQAPHLKPEVKLSYSQLHQQMQQFAAGLQTLTLQPGDRVALFADNGPRWLIADQGSMMAGYVDVVRGTQSDASELLYILEHSGSTALIVEDHATLKKLLPQLGDLPLEFVIFLSDEPPLAEVAGKQLTFTEVLAVGQERALTPVSLTPDSLATLMYTSGTSGKPKGVMLSHGNLLHQVTALEDMIQPQVGDRVLSILPIWHVYERSCEYFIFSQGCTQIYTNLRQVKRDLQTFQPHYMIGVPRLWESLYESVQKQFREQSPRQQRLIRYFFANSQRYIDAQRTAQNLNVLHPNSTAAERAQARLESWVLAPIHALGDRLVYRKVRAALGGQFQHVISGGGSLGMYLENFYEIVGIDILVGYGLTETAPVLTARRPSRNLRGSAGQPIAQTEIQIVDPESRQPLPQGERGLILARGPQVMQGYYQNPEATAKAIDPQGWFDTGDLGHLSTQQDLLITGRAKDTIVLSNGENIEPQPIEDACTRSLFVNQIMLVGQDQKTLGALIVPDLETLQKWAATKQYSLTLPESVETSAPQAEANLTPLTLDSKPVQDLFRSELAREVQDRPGYRPDDRIGPIRLILEPFSVDNGMMTQSFKVRRAVVMERYHDMINGMFD